MQDNNPEDNILLLVAKNVVITKKIYTKEEIELLKTTLKALELVSNLKINIEEEDVENECKTIAN